MRVLSGQQIVEQHLTGWAHLGNGLHTRIATSDFATGLALVQRIAEAAEATNRYPEITLCETRVDIALVRRDAGGVTENDVSLARLISQLATDAGLALDGTRMPRVNLALDTPAKQHVLPFWRALLAFEGSPRDDDPVIRDPAGRLPSVWFRSSGSDEPRQRWHLDVWVDPSQVASRVDACLAAGGRMVDDTHAPAGWVLADAEGNRSCLATWQGRD